MVSWACHPRRSVRSALLPSRLAVCETLLALRSANPLKCGNPSKVPRGLCQAPRGLAPTAYAVRKRCVVRAISHETRRFSRPNRQQIEAPVPGFTILIATYLDSGATLWSLRSRFQLPATSVRCATPHQDHSSRHLSRRCKHRRPFGIGSGLDIVEAEGIRGGRKNALPDFTARQQEVDLWGIKSVRTVILPLSLFPATVCNANPSPPMTKRPPLITSNGLPPCSAARTIQVPCSALTASGG